MVDWTATLTIRGTVYVSAALSSLHPHRRSALRGAGDHASAHLVSCLVCRASEPPPRCRPCARPRSLPPPPSPSSRVASSLVPLAPARPLVSLAPLPAAPPPGVAPLPAESGAGVPPRLPLSLSSRPSPPTSSSLTVATPLRLASPPPPPRPPASPSSPPITSSSLTPTSPPSRAAPPTPRPAPRT